MTEKHEKINYSDFPINTEMCPWGDTPKHWHESIEIMLVLSGSLKLIEDNMTYSAAEGDLILINGNEPHEIKSKNGVYISINIKLSHFVNNTPMMFDCNSAIDSRKERFHNIRGIIAYLMKESLTADGQKSFKYKSYAYSLLDELITKFRIGKNAPIKTKKYLQRLSSIMQYVNEHYTEQLTLSRIAEVEHLSIPYLSAFFEKHMGMSFSQFYANIRLDKAVNDLTQTDLTIDEIAFKNGFGDPRAFVSFFKKKYDILPSQYRKLNSAEKPDLKQPQNDKPGGKSVNNFKKFKREDYMEKLMRYFPSGNFANRSVFETTKYISADDIDTLSGIKNLTHNFKKFISVGRAKEILSRDVQEMLKYAQEHIGYEYIKFHGILSDDMCVYHEDEQGQVELSFVLIDKIIDFLMSINLKPLIQLSFMPAKLASDPDKTIFYSKFITSPPKNIDKWVYLVEQLIRHLEKRYSRKKTEEWLYCVWHEPNFSQSPFAFGSNEQFFDFYNQTYQAVKKINPKLIFGTPSLLILSGEETWFGEFKDYVAQNNCVPEFINLIYYNDDIEVIKSAQHLDQKNRSTQFKINNEERALKQYIARAKELFRDLGCGSLPVYLTEWNLTISHRNLLNDTCFKSCYAAKNLLENYDDLDSFGYWFLTDMVEETQPNPRLFHGGLGLFTYNGIPKPHYWAFYLLNKLGNVLIARGDGYFITKSYGAIQIFLYNYQHYNYQLASGETYDMNFIERYAPFANLGKMDISLTLKNILAKKCLIREYIVNQNNGSSFDLWVNMGAVEIDTPSDMELFKQRAVPKLIIRKSEITSGELNIDVALAPLEIRLIEITLK